MGNSEKAFFVKHTLRMQNLLILSLISLKDFGRAYRRGTVDGGRCIGQVGLAHLRADRLHNCVPKMFTDLNLLVVLFLI